MRNPLLLLALPLVLPSCMPEVEEPQAASEKVTEERLATQSQRLTRVETELHEMRLLFTNQLKRIEEVAAQNGANPGSNTNYSSQPQTPSQQVVIMPPNPVVTHQWDQPSDSSRYSSPPATSHQASRGGHTIQQGDTLSEIAERYGVPLGNLLAANPGTDPLRLQLGRTITIPRGSYAQPGSLASQTSSRYTVRSGDTLSEIAQDYGISLNTLLAQNPGLDPDRLRVGKELRIPGATRQPARSYQQPSLPDYPEPAVEPTRYASPPLESLQTTPTPQQQAPATTPTSQHTALPSKKVLVRFPRVKTWGEVAGDLNVSLETLQILNNCLVSPQTRIPANNTIFIPAE